MLVQRSRVSVRDILAAFGANDLILYAHIVRLIKSKQLDKVMISYLGG